MFARIRFTWLAICAIACVCVLTTPAAAQCPAKTTVADTLYNADGSLASGRVTIAWPTFVIGTCQVIAGQTTVTVASGAFSAQLYPNTTAVPSGTSYRVSFALKSGRVTTEYWVVPASAVPVALAIVRSPSVPVPAMMFGEAQVTNLVSDLAKKIELPSPCSAGKVLESNGSSTPPQVNCVDPSSGSGSQHQVNGANLASNSPVNFQNSSTLAFTNPGAGNLQASLADSAVTAAKLAVSSPSAAQLAGIGDSNISAAALSPDRVAGTAVTQSRTVSTTSPITGGGDLSANRTIACPTCVISVSGMANEISSTGGTTPALSLPSTVDLSSKTMKGGTPLVLDGATADANKTTLVVTDPTAARSFTLPNADSVAVQPATCSGTDKVSAINSSGVIACSADQSGGGSAHNLLSSSHPDTVASFPVLGELLYGNATPAWDKLGGNTTTTKKYLSQTGTGAASASPIWSQPSFSELNGSATAGQVPNLENQNGTLTPAKGGTGASNSATSGRYLRGDGTNFVSSTVAAAGAGSCTNQFVRATVDNAAPTCATVVKADAVSTFVHTDQANTWSTGAQDMGAATSLVVPKAAGAAPTADGDMRYDTTQEAVVAGGNGTVTGFVPRVLRMTNCTTEANCTAGNEVDADSGQQGTTETNFASNWSMPANFLFTNKAIQVCATVELTTTASPPTLTLRFKAGSTVLAAQPAQTTGANMTNRGLTFCLMLQGTEAAGASVSVEAGVLGWGTHNQTLFLNNIDQPVAGIATNGALTIQVSAQWGTATTGNTAQLHQFYVMELN